MIFIIFTFSLAEIRLCRTIVRRRNGYSTILRIFIYLITSAAKKGRPKISPIIKFSPAFFKRRWRPPTAVGALRRARNLSHRRFLFSSFFFCACFAKRKSGKGLNFFILSVSCSWFLRGRGEHCSPAKNHEDTCYLSRF